MLTTRKSVMKQKGFDLPWFTRVMALETLQFYSFRLFWSITSSMFMQGCLSNFQWLLLTTRGSVMKQKGFDLPWFTRVSALETLKFYSFRLVRTITLMFMQGCLSNFQLLLLATRRSVMKQKDFDLSCFTRVMVLAILKLYIFRFVRAITSMFIQGCLLNFQ